MKAVKTLTLGLALASGLSLIAQPKFEDVARQAKEEVESAERELAQLRQEVAEKKVPISVRLTELESQVQEKVLNTTRSLVQLKTARLASAPSKSG